MCVVFFESFLCLGSSRRTPFRSRHRCWISRRQKHCVGTSRCIDKRSSKLDCLYDNTLWILMCTFVLRVFCREVSFSMRNFAHTTSRSLPTCAARAAPQRAKKFSRKLSSWRSARCATTTSRRCSRSTRPRPSRFRAPVSTSSTGAAPQATRWPSA